VGMTQFSELLTMCNTELESCKMLPLITGYIQIS